MTDATWLGTTGDYNLDSNWTGNQVPDGTATFGATGETIITVGAGIDIQGGTATITNNGGLDFFDSSAGAAEIINNNTLGSRALARRAAPRSPTTSTATLPSSTRALPATPRSSTMIHRQWRL